MKMKCLCSYLQVTYRFRNVMTAHAIFFFQVPTLNHMLHLNLGFQKKPNPQALFFSSKLQKKKTLALRKHEASKKEIRLFRSSCLYISLVCKGLWLITAFWKTRISFHEQC